MFNSTLQLFVTNTENSVRMIRFAALALMLLASLLLPEVAFAHPMGGGPGG